MRDQSPNAALFLHDMMHGCLIVRDECARQVEGIHTISGGWGAVGSKTTHPLPVWLDFNVHVDSGEEKALLCEIHVFEV